MQPSETVSQATTLPAGVEIKVRHPKFDFAKDRKYWYDNDPLVTHFLNTLSMLFPDGEKFFIDSVVHYRDQITDPVLKKHISAFAAQEIAHTAEHRKYNLVAVGKRAEKAERICATILGLGRRYLSPKAQLAGTVAMEHITASLAHEVLRNPLYARSMDSEHGNLWLWHAAEETEHKSVAHDVYRAAGGGYFLRTGALLLWTAVWIPVVTGVCASFLWKDGELFKLRNIRSFVKWFLVSPGFVTRVAPKWLQFFRPGFEPWDLENSKLVIRWREKYAAA